MVELRSAASPTGASSSRIQAARSLICIAETSPMCLPRIRDDRAASDRREPPHSGQVAKTTARSTNARMCGCIASRSLPSIDFWICRISPVKVRLMPSTLTLVGSW